MSKTTNQYDELDKLLDERGTRAEVYVAASKAIVVDDIVRYMNTAKVSRSELAKRMGTSRMAVNRLLDPNNTGVTLETLARVAMALGLELTVRLGMPTTPGRRPRIVKTKPMAATRKRRTAT